MDNSTRIEDMALGADDSEKIEIKFSEPRLGLNGLVHRLIPLDGTYKGRVELTITGLPSGLKVFLAEAVEINIHDGSPHRGGAVYSTSSVNLHANGKFAIIRFNVAWNAPLKSGLMVVMG
jgi:hypothetical protein